MSNIEISPQLKSDTDPDTGIRTQHIENAIRSADKSNEIEFDNCKLLICTKNIEAANPPYTLLTISTASSKNVNVMDAYKVYPTLASNTKNLSPIELLKKFIDKFGLNCLIASGEKKKLFLKHSFNIDYIPTTQDLNLKPIINKNLHKEYLISSIVKWDYENEFISIKYHIGYCLNIDAYKKWVQSRGTPKQETPHIVKLEQFVNNTILPHTEGKNFSDKVYTTIHDFCYFCRQDPEPLTNLHEEMIRGLFVFTLKIIFHSADSETHHYNGKSDFKITNPENMYENNNWGI